MSIRHLEPRASSLVVCSLTVSSDKRCHNSVHQGLNIHNTSQVLELKLSASLVPFSVFLDQESLTPHRSKMLFTLTVFSVCGAAILILFGAFRVFKVLLMKASRTFKHNTNDSKGYRSPIARIKGLGRRRRHSQRSITGRRNKKRTVVNHYYVKTLSIQTDSTAEIISQPGFKPVNMKSAIMEEFLELYDYPCR